ncbi:MAG: S46 family peptidase [Planctomycetota bacterium]|nr:S46 family peptidase [Planctomycetota bacterium]
MKSILRTTSAAFALLCLSSSFVRADEGMWLFNRPPTKEIKQRYGFDLTPEWLEHVQKSAVRLSTGGSGSLVSANGLVMTNHHVGRDMIQKLSTAEKNFIQDGFYAKSGAEELQCPDLEVVILWEIQDVTELVNSVVTPDMNAADANAARKKQLEALEKDSLEKTKLKSDIVTLWQGARYHLYRYKRFADVRLVMAPEKGIASFGGDPDNFEFPRFNLDMCFFRIWDNGAPLKSEHFLKWSRNGAADADLVFVVGNPGSTQRLNTVDHVKFIRDTQYPMSMRNVWRREVQLAGFMGRGNEQRRVAESMYASVTNSRKARTGIFAGLQNPAFIAAKVAAEKALTTLVDSNPEWKAKWGDAWKQIAGAKKVHAEMLQRFTALGGPGLGLGGQLFAKAKDLVRNADEAAKPSGERLREYRDSAKATFELGLFSPAPISTEFEIENLAAGLQLMGELLGCEDPTFVKALAGKSPQARAEELVRGTKLGDVAERKRLHAGGKAAIDASNDSMIQLVKALDAESRSMRKRADDEIEAPEKEGYAKVAAANFQLKGEDQYPDATFTLRLSYGTVKGYTQNGVDIAPFTNFGGLFKRAEERGGVDPFDIPEKWTAAREKLNPNTPFNFVSTCDIIGGNSGSPVVNKQGEIVGLIFDGNIQSLVGDLWYEEGLNRAVSVDSRAMIESMRKVYDAGALADEITAAGHAAVDAGAR